MSKIKIIIVGVIVGFIVGFICYYLYKRNQRKKAEELKDLKEKL